jgi:membrane-associated phospholipid phosphatase
LALAAFCLLAFAVAYLVFVQTELGARGDEAAFAGRGAATVRGTQFAQNLLTSISAGTLLLAVGAIVVQGLVRGRWTLALVAATVIAGSVLCAEVLKHFILERPELVFSPIDQNSFPSGHTTVAYSLGVAATIVAPASFRDRVAFVAIAYGGAVGVATVAAGWHRPSDVLGSYLVTIAIASLTVAAALTLNRRDFQRSPFSGPDASMWTRWLGIGGAMLVGAYIVAVAVVIAGAVGITDWSRVHGAFIAGCASLVAAAALLMVAFLAALGRSSAAGLEPS